ncbi:MAG: protein kinase domain-containing protein, partial [Planctomycetota bacterium]
MTDTAVNYRPLAPGDRLGEWRLEGRLGENESGDVWRVRHHALDRQAAVIVATDPVQAEVLRVSGASHQKVHHPRVVQTLGLDLDNQPPYLGWVDGESLRDRLNRGRMQPAEARRVVEEILEGLEAAHALRICHGALRPERILLAGGTDVRINGFGTPPAAAEQDGAVVISDALDAEGARQARLREYVAPELRGGEAATVA